MNKLVLSSLLVIAAGVSIRSFGTEIEVLDDDAKGDVSNLQIVIFQGDVELNLPPVADAAHNVAEGDFSDLKVDIDFLGDIEFDLQSDILDGENAPEHRAIDFAIENLHQRHPDALEDEEICYGIKNLFRWNQGQKRDAIENPKVNYFFRHLFEEPIEDDSFGLEALFPEDEDDEDAPEHRAIDFAIENLYQRNNEESWKTLIVSHLTSKAAKVTGVVAATALVATGVYKYVRSLQAKKASNACDECLNMQAVDA